ncbi:fibronectin type III domain-containing protein [Pedobacter aquatilis]|uniref:fibronectin type III domain-containing protein n=1 Tax=Pedobacter aquatilis TaxID=351343 RepID=UPI00292EE8F9|nr:fibronectin type III domain-containing protein [Pedobacter aquatilis]
MNLNIPIKSSGSTLSADEFNLIVPAVNSKADESLLSSYLTLTGATNTFQLKGNYLVAADVVGKYLSTGTTFSYSNLTEKPVIPDAYTKSQSDGKYILTGTTFNYQDLINKPTIPSITGLASETFVLNSLTGKSNVSDVYSKSDIDSKGFLTGVTYTQVTGKPILSAIATSGAYADLAGKPDLATKADLVSGTVPINQLPEATLSPLQFETLPDGTIGIKLSYLQSLGLGGTTPTLTAPTNLIISGATGSALTISWSTVANATSYELQRANNAAYTGATTLYNGATASFNNTGLTASTNYFYRVKAKAASYSDSAYVAASGATIATTGATYTVEKTVFVNFKSEYNGVPTSNPAYVNVAQPSNTTLQTASGYTSANLVDITNTPTGFQISNITPFAGAVGEISAAQTTAGDTGVYQNAMVNTGWIVNGGNNAKLKIFGLNASKFYQLYFLMPTAQDTVRGVTIGATTINKPVTASATTFGVAGNGLNDPQFIVFNNLTGTQLEATITRVSGSWEAALAMMVIEQTNIAKP